MINQLYLKRAENIRRDYLKLVRELNNYDKMAKQLAESIQLRVGQLNDLYKEIDSEKVSNVEAAKDKLNTIMINLERDVNSIDQKIKNINKKMDQLREDEVKLYKELKQKYNTSDEELKNEINQHLKKKMLN